MFEGLVTARQARELSIQNDSDTRNLFSRVKNAINLAIIKGKSEAKVEARWQYSIAGMDEELEWRDYKHDSVDVITKYLESNGYDVVIRSCYDKDNPTYSYRSLEIKW